MELIVVLKNNVNGKFWKIRFKKKQLKYKQHSKLRMSLTFTWKKWRVGSPYNAIRSNTHIGKGGAEQSGESHGHHGNERERPCGEDSEQRARGTFI